MADENAPYGKRIKVKTRSCQLTVAYLDITRALGGPFHHLYIGPAPQKILNVMCALRCCNLELEWSILHLGGVHAKISKI